MCTKSLTSFPSCSEDLLWAPRAASFSARAVYNMGQCCKITGFPQCFLLFMRVTMATLERLHVGGSRAFPAEPTQLRNPWRRRCARSRPRRSPRSRALLAHKKLIVERVESVEGRKQEPCLNTYTQKCELDPAGFKFGRRIRTQRCLSWSGREEGK